MRPSNPPRNVAQFKNLESVAIASQLMPGARIRRVDFCSRSARHRAGVLSRAAKAEYCQRCAGKSHDATKAAIGAGQKRRVTLIWHYGYVEFAAPRQHGIQGGRGQHI